MLRNFTFTVAILAWASAAGQAQQGNPLLSSGTPIGQPLLRSVGTPVPKAAPNVGQPVGAPPGAQPQMQPPGSIPFDLSNVVAPINPEYLPPALRPVQTPNIFETAYQKWLGLFGLGKPPEVKNNYTPGLSRRNRERAREREWWRD
ncbi:MAG: hypothetical protein U0798_03685 [Gemmataceae bacterium]